MSTTFDARDGDSLTPSPPGAVLADEESLHRTFLAEYDALTQEARADLGNDALALVPKVVEGSFVRAWDARERFKTPQDIHQFLVEDVHHASARALSRRAGARRLAGHEHADAHAMSQTSPEESWEHILKALHGEAHSPKALADLAAVSRHEAAVHVAQAGKEAPPWIAIAIGALLVIGIVAFSAWSSRTNSGARFAQALSATDVRAVTSPTAQIGTVTLGDGTRVRLAPESKLTIPRAFGTEMRVVKVEGIASFEVAPGLPREFNVHAAGVPIVAKGTAFSVLVHPDSAVTVVVTEGSVTVGEGDDNEVATGGAVVVKGDTRRPATPAEKDQADMWRSGSISVADRPLRDVLPVLRRWYGLTIAVKPDSLLDRKVTLRASLDSTRQAIRGVEQSARVQFGYVGQNMIFTDSAAKAPAKAAKPATKR
jgi:ferric-dicitrate binding protein FerR (iron transport regulator)